MCVESSDDDDVFGYVGSVFFFLFGFRFVCVCITPNRGCSRLDVGTSHVHGKRNRLRMFGVAWVSLLAHVKWLSPICCDMRMHTNRCAIDKRHGQLGYRVHQLESDLYCNFPHINNRN